MSKYENTGAFNRCISFPAICTSFPAITFPDNFVVPLSSMNNSVTILHSV